jgi:hypothetical protein
MSDADNECPFWTWPATISGLGAFFAGALWIISMINQAECEKKGGNTVKDNICYHVTMKKID